MSPKSPETMICTNRCKPFLPVKHTLSSPGHRRLSSYRMCLYKSYICFSLRATSTTSTLACLLNQHHGTLCKRIHMILLDLSSRWSKGCRPSCATSTHAAYCVTNYSAASPVATPRTSSLIIQSFSLILCILCFRERCCCGLMHLLVCRGRSLPVAA